MGYPILITGAPVITVSVKGSPTGAAAKAMVEVIFSMHEVPCRARNPYPLLFSMHEPLVDMCKVTFPHCQPICPLFPSHKPYFALFGHPGSPFDFP